MTLNKLHDIHLSLTKSSPLIIRAEAFINQRWILSPVCARWHIPVSSHTVSPTQFGPSLLFARFSRKILSDSVHYPLFFAVLFLVFPSFSCRPLPRGLLLWWCRAGLAISTMISSCPDISISPLLDNFLFLFSHSWDNGFFGISP